MKLRMTTITRTTLVAAALLGACGGADDPEAADPSCDPEVDEVLAAWAEAGFSGSVAMATGGDVDCVAAYGHADEATERPNTPDTVFAIGSITKAVTAATIHRLVDEGRLDVDDRVGDLLPGLTAPIADATVQQLLLHTSGLNGTIGEDHVPLSHDEAIARLNDFEREHEPGAEFLYSNGGYSLLALVIEELSDDTYRDATMQTLELPDGHVAGGFWDGEPAAPGPRAVGYDDHGEPTTAGGDFAGPHWALDGNGSLAMTMTDLAAWTRALFSGDLLSTESTAAIALPGHVVADGIAVTPGWGRYDARLFGEPVYLSAGGGDGGHSAVVAWLPESDRVVAMASNTDGVTAEELLEVLLEALVAGEPLPRPEGSPVEADPAEVAAAAGTYEVEGGGTLTVEATDRRLDVTAHDADAVDALFPRPEDADDHEADVLDLLAGESVVGREELDALASLLGSVEDVSILGTVDDGGALRTYVTASGGGEEVLAWYSIDDAGGVQAAEVATDPPRLRVVPVGPGEFRPDDPTGIGPDVTIHVDGDNLRIAGPDGPVTARRGAP